MDTPNPRRRRPQPEIASKSTPGPKSNKTGQVVSILRGSDAGMTIEEVAAEIGWSKASITRIIQWMLFVTRSGVRKVIVSKNSENATTYRVA